MLSTKRLTPILFAVFLLLATLFFLNTPSASLDAAPIGVGGDASQHQDTKLQLPEQLATTPPQLAAAPPTTTSTPAPAPETTTPSSAPEKTNDAVNISYDKTTPPTVGCEAIVHDLQERIIEAYQTLLEGVRYANIWGYLGPLIPVLSGPAKLTILCRNRK